MLKARTHALVLSCCVAIVALSTLLLPWITGYGTIQHQFVVLGAWGVVAAITSGRYADIHHGPVWAVALLINVLCFLVPAGLFFLTVRRRWPGAAGVGVVLWCAFYLACLFILFPASDGP
jgi:hypothetical protein